MLIIIIIIIMLIIIIILKIIGCVAYYLTSLSLSLSIYRYICYDLSSKTLNEQKKTARTRCGKRETATTRNFASWTFCSSHNAFWQVKNCHDAKFASWLLKKTIRTTTTRSGKTELTERVVVVSFNSHDTM
jgi:hypothetical protein